MAPNPTGSFFKFLSGFLTFITVSFVVTYAVTTYTEKQNAEKQTAAAIEAMLVHTK